MLALLLALLAAAHDDTESLAVLEAGEDAWILRISVDADRAMQTLGVDRPDGTKWTARDVEEKEAALLDHLSQHVRLELDDEAWIPRPQRVDRVSGLDPVFGIERPLQLEARYELEPPGRDFRLIVRQDLFLETETAHRHRFRWESGPEPLEWGVFPGRGLELELEDPTEAGRRARQQQYFRAGLHAVREARWTLLFLVVAGLGAASFLRVLGIGLAFLGAGAGALALAAFGAVEPSARLIALAAPFSVAYVAAENLWTADRRFRWATAGLFGCVFGLRLHQLLREHGQPELAAEDCALAFAAGNLAALSAAFLVIAPLVRLASAEARTARILRAVLSGGIAAFAAWGLIEAI